MITDLITRRKLLKFLLYKNSSYKNQDIDISKNTPNSLIYDLIIPWNASYGVTFQSIIKSYLKTPVFGTPLSYT